MRQEAINRRDNAISMAMKRKEEYLGARVPKELRDRVIGRAKELEIPVSILIRNVLEEAFKDGESGLSVMSATDSKENKTKKKTKFSSVLGWDKITLNKHVACSSCGVDLNSGTTVTLGVGGSEPVVLCSSCEDQV